MRSGCLLDEISVGSRHIEMGGLYQGGNGDTLLGEK
jgi:hypothetical protein